MIYPFTYLYLVGFAAMLVAAVAIWLAVAPQPAKKWLVLAPLLLCGWCLSDLLSNLAATSVQGHWVGLIFAPVWAFVPFVALRGAQRYVDSEGALGGATATALLLLPGIGSLILMYTGLLQRDFRPAAVNGLFFVPQATAWQQLVNAYFIAYIVTAGAVLLVAARRTGDPVIKVMSKYYLLGIVPATLLGAITNGGLAPAGLEPPYLGSIMASCVVGSVALGVVRQGFFRPIHRLAVERDIALDSLSRREELLQALPFGVAIVPSGGHRPLLVNRPFERLTGVGDGAELPAPLQRTIQDCSEEHPSCELSWPMPSNPQQRLIVHVASLTYGGVQARVVGLRDITQERLLEGRLQRAEQLEALGTLAGGIAHDMNNILGTIMLAASGMELGASEEGNARTDAARIIRACRRGRALTDNILMHTHRRRPTAVPVDLDPLVKECLRELESALPDNVAVQLAPSDAPPVVLGDATQLSRALDNLCRNGVEAMGTGGVLRVDIAVVEVDRAAHSLHPDLALGPYVQIRVSDTGCGMDAQTAKRCFEPLFTTKPIGRGTGLGLAVAFGTVRDHHGAIHVESSPGEGTSMTVWLPAHAAPHAREEPGGAAPGTRSVAEAEAGGGPAPAAARPGARVLLVDDEAALRRLGRRQLEARGYEVLDAENGRAALALLARESFAVDLIILDMVMPEMNGPETFAELSERAPEIPVILISGYAQAGEIDRLLAAGAAAFLKKPFDAAALREAVHDVLCRRADPAPS